MYGNAEYKWEWDSNQGCREGTIGDTLILDKYLKQQLDVWKIKSI